MNRYVSYKVGVKKMEQELDLELLVKSIRKTNLLASVLLNSRQLIQAKYQKSNMILPNEILKDSISENSSEDDLKRIQMDDGQDQSRNIEAIETKLISGVIGEQDVSPVHVWFDRSRSNVHPIQSLPSDLSGIMKLQNNKIYAKSNPSCFNKLNYLRSCLCKNKLLEMHIYSCLIFFEIFLFTILAYNSNIYQICNSNCKE